MPKKLLESAFIDILNIPAEEFQQQKYFFYRWAVYIEKEIGLNRGKQVVSLITFEDMKALLPELTIRVKAIYSGNLFSLNESEVKDFSFYKNISAVELVSLRFAEQDNVIVIARNETTCTIVYETLDVNEFNQPIVEESHIPAIQSYIKYRIVEQARLLSALREGGNYYQLRNEAKEQERDYSVAIINARALEQFKETEKVTESNDLIITESDGDFDFSK